MAKVLVEAPPGGSIRFAIGGCWLGALLVASGDEGLCAILIGDQPESLGQDLVARFPHATITADQAGLAASLAAVRHFLEAPARGLALPLAPRGTDFQRRVWQALCTIPAGSTITYTALADRLGIPGAVRAVAGACAANPLAVAVPCHRVLRRDGGLAGYRWGLERKRALIDREAQP